MKPELRALKSEGGGATNCEYGCIFTQVAVCVVGGTEPLAATIIPPLVFCRSRLWRNAISIHLFHSFHFLESDTQFNYPLFDGAERATKCLPPTHPTLPQPPLSITLLPPSTLHSLTSRKGSRGAETMMDRV